MEEQSILKPMVDLHYYSVHVCAFFRLKDVRDIQPTSMGVKNGSVLPWQGISSTTLPLNIKYFSKMCNYTLQESREKKRCKE